MGRLDPHRNVFYYYGSGTRENNTTKALINVLEHCKREKVLKKFLELLGIAFEGDLGDVKFEMQKRTIGYEAISKVSQRVLLGISPKGAYEGFETSETDAEEKEPEAERFSIPDAWIWCDDFVILFENKVLSELDADQMRRHKKKLLIEEEEREDNAVEERVFSWPRMYNFFSGLISSMGGKDVFILEQFCDYLKVLDLGKFAGFRPEHFNAFIEDDQELRIQARRALEMLLIETREALPARLKQKLPEYSIGRVEPDHVWGSLAVAADRHKRGNMPHFTVNLHSNLARIFFNIERKKPMKKLCDKVKAKKEEFLQLFKKIARTGYDESLDYILPEYEWEIFERVHHRVNIYKSAIMFDINADYVDKDVIDLVIRKIEAKDYLIEFHIAKIFKRHEVIAKKEKFKEEVVKTILELEPFYDFAIEK